MTTTETETHEVIKFVYNECEISVHQVGEEPYFDKYQVRWTDFVANDWVETYHDLSDALARVSALVKCGESDWGRGFSVGSEDFHKYSHEFFNKVTQ